MNCRKLIHILTLAVTSAMGLGGLTIEARPYLNQTSSASLSASTSGKIIGGSVAPIGSRPHQAALFSNGQFFCGGSVIGRTVILTAAHCVSPVPPNLIIKAGSNSLSATTQFTQFTQTRPVSSVLVHPQHIPSGDNDIALLFLSEPIFFSGMLTQAPLPGLGEVPPPPGTILTAIGWGKTSLDGQVSDMLRQMSAPVISTPDCSTMYTSAYPTIGNRVTERMICLDTRGGMDTCAGDSGGELVSATGALVGLTSFGFGCRLSGSGGYPGVYTSVYAHRDWIRANAGI